MSVLTMSGRRTQQVFGWMCFIWFVSAADTAGRQVVILENPSPVVASCGEHVTLTCSLNSTQHIFLFAWSDGEKQLCQHNHTHPQDSEVLCESTTEQSWRRLSVTLLNVRPVHERKYICKVRSSDGTEQPSTVLTVKNCLRSSSMFISGSSAECRFDGVDPGSTAHWFQGDKNLTDDAVTTQALEPNGRFNVTSTLTLNKTDQPVNCSLWMHDQNQYHTSQQVLGSLVTEGRGMTTPASSDRRRLQWICLLVEVLVFKSMV